MQKDDAGNGRRVFYAVDDTAGKGDDEFIYVIYPQKGEQPRSQNACRRNRHGKEQLIIFCLKELCLRQEYAADESQQKDHEPHESEVEPSHSRFRKNVADGEEDPGEEKEKHDDNIDHHNSQECCGSGVFSAVFFLCEHSRQN